MSEKKVLIAFATRYGGTALISQELAKEFEKLDLKSTVYDLKSDKSKNWPSIDEFDGIIVGSSIKIGRWMKEPQKFLKNNEKSLTKKDKILGIFVSCGTALEDYNEAVEKYLVNFKEKKGIPADLYDTFGVIVDLTDPSNPGKFARPLLIDILNKHAESFGLKINENGRSDLINRERLQKFVNKFAELINQN